MNEKELIEMVMSNPNDMELGKKIREYVWQIIESNKKAR